MRETKWILKQFKPDKYKNIDLDILRLLHNRGITEDKDIDNFLNPDLDNISDPFTLKDIDKAVQRILKAKDNNETIWIYGDYDVDGITSTSLCYLALTEIGIDVKYYIPLRDEGYGLNNEAMDYIKGQGGSLIITVDCGITALKEIDYANELGLEIIVTDHHEMAQSLPRAFATINPKRNENTFEFKYLAGVGTAFMLILALYTTLNKKEDSYKFLDIVAIGTVADIVKLAEENRIFTYFGIKLLNNSKWLGLNMLIKTVFEEDYKDRKFSTYDIGFIIAPIFNAAGRLEDAKKAVELLISDNHVQCTNIISELLSNNSQRKDIQNNIFEYAVNEIERQKLNTKNIIVVANKDFHHGVIGIVASKILDRYYKPTIIMEIKEDEGIATASCRSVEGFNITTALTSVSHLLLKYGGHSGAAGFSIAIENIEKFIEEINKIADATLSQDNLIRPVKLDLELPIYKVSYDFINKISVLEPFGFGNPSPLFSIKNCKISNLRLIGKEKNHLMMNIVKDDLEIKNCVWFNSDDVYDELCGLEYVDIAFKLKLETFKDRYMYKLYLEDVQPPSIQAKDNDTSLYDISYPIETVVYTRKKIDDAKLNLVFLENEINITYDRSFLTTLDLQTTHLLLKLKKLYNYDFNIKVKDIIMKDENYNVHIYIDRNYDFTSYSIKDSSLFVDIKNFLIGDFQYNSIQKKVLGEIFKKKNNVSLITRKKRGINTIIQTISLYHNSLEKKIICVTDEILPQKTTHNIVCKNKFETGYDFYIFYNYNENIPENINYLAIFDNNNQNISNNCTVINDEFILPENIILVEKESEKPNTVVFSNNLSLDNRKKLLSDIKNNQIVFATEDILLYL